MTRHLYNEGNTDLASSVSAQPATTHRVQETEQRVECPSSTPGRLTDVHVKPPRLHNAHADEIGLKTCLTGVFIGVLGAVTCIRMQRLELVWLPILGMTICVAVCMRFRRMIIRRRHARCEQLRKANKRYLPKMLQTLSEGNTQTLADLIAELGRLEYTGLTIRGGPRAHVKPITPLKVPFEPQPLHDANSNLSAILAWHGRKPGLTDMPPSIEGSGRSSSLRRARRWLRSSRDIAYVCLISLTALLRVRSVKALAAVIAVVGACWGLLALVERSCGVEWLIVPGGVVLRRNTWRATRSMPQLLTRMSSVLCVMEIRAGKFEAIMTQGRHLYSREMTTTEAEFLLRAWLSPVPPPTLTLLSELT